jgi:hypothetical protein
MISHCIPNFSACRQILSSSRRNAFTPLAGATGSVSFVNTWAEVGMFKNSDQYFEERFATEVRMARHAACPEAARVHMKLAAAYRAKLSHSGMQGKAE